MLSFNPNDILETINMIDEENLDVRTITMGISLLDCADSDIDRSCEKVYEKSSVRPKTWSGPARTLSANTAFPSSTSASPSPPSPS